MKVEEIKKIVLEKGDVLAVKIPKDSNALQTKRAVEYFQKAFPDNKTIIYTDEIEFTNVKKGN